MMIDVIIVMGILMQNHKCNKVENAFPIFKVCRLIRVHTDSHHNDHLTLGFRLIFMCSHCNYAVLCSLGRAQFGAEGAVLCSTCTMLS